MPVRMRWNAICDLGSIRRISSQQAAVALRPFYFAVHPDRFANKPDVRATNERALQTFNGYLNDLFPVQRPPPPTKIAFYIAEKGKRELRKVEISLSGSDARSIIVRTLEQCNLSTKNVPVSPKDAARTGKPRNAFDSSEMDAAQEMIKLYRKKHAGQFIRRNDLAAALNKHKEAAVQARKTFEKMSKVLEDEVNQLRDRTGVTEIIWQANWAKSHMRRSLVTVNRMIDHAPISGAGNAVIEALRGYCLRFGRWSCVSCDGGVQFGVQDVPEEWERICNEASVRRTQLNDLNAARSRLSELLGNAQIVTSPEHSLAKTVDQIQSLIVRILARDDSERSRLQTLGANTLIEVVSAYDALILGKDGRLLVPCNSSIDHVIDFMNENAHLSRQINESLHQLQSDAENRRRECMKSMKLLDLTWDQGINLEDLLSSMDRLQQNERLRELVVDMWLHFDTNPTIYVMSDGRLSVPLEWV